MVDGGVCRCRDSRRFSDRASPRWSLHSASFCILFFFVLSNLQWRWVFWITAPVSVLSLIQVIFFLPLKPVTGSFKSKLKKIDFLGSFLMLIATVFILISISSGGSTFAWSSPVVIVLLVLGGVILVVFLFVEWRYAALPIVPLYLLSQPSLLALTAITFLAGCYYYSNVYFLPIYFQIILNPPAGALLSSALLQSLLLPQIATAMAAGFVVQKYSSLYISLTL